MPQTIFSIKTYGCQDCNWHTDNKELEGKNCPSCKDCILKRETDPNRMMQITIMGEEDIDSEIEKMEQRKKMTNEEKDIHKTKRLQDIQKSIDRNILLKHDK